MNPTQHKDRDDSQLFLVRLWAEDNDRRGTEDNGGSGGHVEWCGKLQSVVSGRAHYFRGWQTLIDLLLEMTGNDRIDVNAQGVSSTEVLQ
jgi:hypothetical protein